MEVELTAEEETAIREAAYNGESEPEIASVEVEAVDGQRGVADVGGFEVAVVHGRPVEVDGPCGAFFDAGRGIAVRDGRAEAGDGFGAEFEDTAEADVGVLGGGAGAFAVEIAASIRGGVGP